MQGRVARIRMNPSQTRLAVIAAGGAIGTLARAGLADALPHRVDQWPWATFIANIAGAFILGWLLTRLAERTAPAQHWRFFAGTGFCGALTTISTLQFQTFQFARHDELVLAVGYPLASITAGMIVATAGVMLARWGRHW
jgi:CrcB protein